jgi:hypothetical protein
MQMKEDEAISRSVRHRHPRCFGNSAISYRLHEQHHDVTKGQNCAMTTFCIYTLTPWSTVHLEELPRSHDLDTGPSLRKKKLVHPSYLLSTRSALILSPVSVTKDGVRIGNLIYWPFACRNNN